MENGDLSNGVPPSWMFVFEGVLGVLSGPRAVALEWADSKAHRWRSAVNRWTLTDFTKNLWDLAWRYDVRAVVVTFRGEGFSEALADRLSDLPISRVLDFVDADELAKQLAYMPYVQRVYHANTARPYVYGDRGFLVTTPSELRY